MFLAVATANSNAVDDETLLGLVAQPASFIWARRSGCTVDHVKLAILPTPATHGERGPTAMKQSKSTEREEGIAGHRTVSSCTALQCTYTHPYLLDSDALSSVTRITSVDGHTLIIVDESPHNTDLCKK